jgi:serine O-acetyltransferase
MRIDKVEEIEIPIAESYRDAIELARSDYFRIKGGPRDISVFRMWTYTLWEPSFAFLFWHRLSSYKSKSLLYYISKLVHRHYIFKYGILIPSSTKIGYGLLLGHPLCIAVNPTAVVGNNCNLYHGVTIGSNEGKAAVIGDNVYIGPNVSVVESVRIGSNVTIGAGTVIAKDVPENATVVGNPQHITSYNNPGRYIGNRW